MSEKDYDGAVPYEGEIYLYRVDECGRYWAICWGTSYEISAEGELRQAIDDDIEHQLRKRGAST